MMTSFSHASWKPLVWQEKEVSEARYGNEAIGRKKASHYNHASPIYSGLIIRDLIKSFLIGPSQFGTQPAVNETRNPPEHATFKHTHLQAMPEDSSKLGDKQDAQEDSLQACRRAVSGYFQL